MKEREEEKRGYIPYPLAAFVAVPGDTGGRPGETRRAVSISPSRGEYDRARYEGMSARGKGESAARDREIGMRRAGVCLRRGTPPATLSSVCLLLFLAAIPLSPRTSVRLSGGRRARGERSEMDSKIKTKRGTNRRHQTGWRREDGGGMEISEHWFSLRSGSGGQSLGIDLFKTQSSAIDKLAVLKPLSKPTSAHNVLRPV
ncbi:unnamed protein product [Pleuronectes platessa]|uniref:Uncharacterized protein n=1 Tax=Pleuronectes platessa TaxID=8262 RepID=A0A9N7V3N9_PLEPL|nr:unnamed protein product [Pleuronectes platessa]